MNVSPLNELVLRDHVHELIEHYYCLGTLGLGERPQITISSQTVYPFQKFKVVKYQSPQSSTLPLLVRCFQATERFCLSKNTVDDMLMLGQLFKETLAAIALCEGNTRLNLYGIKAAVSSFRDEGFQTYIQTCLEGTAKTFNLSEAQKKVRSAASEKLKSELTSLETTVKAKISNAESELEESSRKEIHAQFLAMFSELSPYNRSTRPKEYLKGSAVRDVLKDEFSEDLINRAFKYFRLEKREEFDTNLLQFLIQIITENLTIKELGYMRARAEHSIFAPILLQYPPDVASWTQLQISTCRSILNRRHPNYLLSEITLKQVLRRYKIDSFWPNVKPLEPVIVTESSYLTSFTPAGGWGLYISKMFMVSLYGNFAPQQPEDIERIRNTYQRFGGISASLITVDFVEVKIKHFQVNSFMEQISQRGGRSVDIILSDSGRKIPAIQFPNIQDDLVADLQSFGVLDPLHKNFIWEYFNSGNQTYLVCKSDYDDIVRAFTSDTLGLDPTKASIVERAQKRQVAHSTVILSGGLINKADSLRTAQEVASFLVNGLDVIIFEDSYPKVHNMKSVTHAYSTLNSIYDYLVTLGVTNQQMLWKGVSLGSLSSVLAAAAHPGCGVIVDQSFVNFSSAIAEATNFSGKHLIHPLITSFLNASDLNYHIDHALPNVQGSICVINNNFDGVIHSSERNRVIDSLPKEQSRNVIYMDDPKLQHSVGWYCDRQTAKELAQFLVQKSFSKGSIL